MATTARKPASPVGKAIGRVKALASAQKVATGNAPKTAGAKKVPTQRRIVQTGMGNLSVPVKAVKPKKPSTEVKFMGFAIPVTRKSSDSDEGIPTITLNKVSDLTRLIAKLPKGCTISASSNTISVFNKSGALIADLFTFANHAGK